MVIRDNKGKPRKRAKGPVDTIPREDERLISKLQTESLKVHGDPLDPPKKNPAKKKGANAEEKRNR
jgi:hypothetical protein